MKHTLIALGVFFCQAASSDVAVMPKWFYEMPDEPGVRFAVGYSRALANRDTAIAYAARDAAYQLSLAEETIVRGERLFETLPGGRVAYRGEVFKEQPTGTTTACFLDTLVTSEMVLVLASSRAPRSRINGEKGSISPLPPPWIAEIPERDGMHYSVGMARVYFYEEHSWQEAENRARQEMAYSILTRQKSLMKGSGQATTGVMATATSVRLHDVQVLARWKSDTVCFVLSRARLGTSPISPAAQSTMKRTYQP